MCRKARNLRALFLSAVKNSKTAADAALKRYVSSIDPLSPSTSLSEAITQRSLRSSKSKKEFPKLPVDSRRSTLEEPVALDSEASEEHITRAISSILCEATSTSSPQPSEELNSWKNVLAIPWFSNMSNSDLSSCRKRVSRERKQKWIFKNTQHNRFNKLVGNCAQKLGTGTAIEVFCKLGRETGEKEYSALIGICIEKARRTNDVEVVLEQISNVFFLTTTMKEQGFKLEDEIYGPVLMFFIEMDMMNEFQSFSDADAALKRYVSSIDPLSPSTSLSEAITQRSLRSSKSKKEFPKLPVDSRRSTLEEPVALDSEASEEHITRAISSILCEATSTSSPQPSEELNSWKNVLAIPWFSNMSNSDLSSRRKRVSRERKQKWIFKSTQHNRFNKLVGNCAQKLGTGTAIEVFCKLGRETGEKEYSALIGICMEKARRTNDVEVVLEQISNVFFLTTTMKEQGFKLEDEIYGPVLMFFIEMDMMNEFQSFSELLKNGNPTSVSRLGYYEMVSLVRTNDMMKVHDLCKDALTEDGTDKTSLRENYMLALSENGWKEEFLMLLETTDTKKFSSVDYVVNIFKSFGRLSLENVAEKLLLEFKTSEHGEENISNFILSYALSIPNLAFEDTISKFKNLHIRLELNPSSASYEKLIIYCCDFLEVHLALDLAKEMCEAGFMLSADKLHPILDACGESYNANLVHQIYSIICQYDLEPNGETFRRMINLCVRMKDFNGAYDMLKDLEKVNLSPTSGMYNAIMAGYYREKNIQGVLMVLRQMELADIKPDSQTFSLLLTNCYQENDITKYYEELKTSGIQVTKQIFMALINAYTNCGQFEKAKQIILDKRIPVRNLNELKSVLVSSLASCGQVDDALSVYNEVKQAGCDLEPKAVISLIEHLQSGAELSIMLQLLDELKDPHYWIEGCSRVILFCVLHKHLSSAIDLLRQLKNNSSEGELGWEGIFDEVFCQIAELDPTYLEVGLELLRVIKHELGLSPPRKCLDFLLSTCINAKDLDNSRLIWKEYQSAGLPYNVISFLRMYQALLACGDRKSAKILLGKIPKSDPHVRSIIKESEAVYLKRNKNNKTAKTQT